MPVRRLAVAVALALSLSAAASAQEVAGGTASDRVTNWTAPPYWMPASPATDKDAIALNAIVGRSAEARVSPEAIQAAPTPLAFTGINPCRLADTRGNGFSGQFGPPQITPAGRTITIANFCGIPATAQAVSFNFSAVNIPGAGFLVAYPAGAAFPAAATMTYNQNTPNLSNAAVVPLGTGGAITVVAGVVSIDLVIDVNGYYAPQVVVDTVNGLTGAVTLAAGSNISITPAGSTLTIANTAPAAWSRTGNAGTTPGTNFVGTTDAQALEIKVNGARSFRLEPGTPSNNFGPNLIAGYQSNSVTVGATGATISGGGQAGSTNLVTDNYGTVGGGFANQAGDAAGDFEGASNATVAGGLGNIASGNRSFVGGGSANTASGSASAIPGGQANLASATWATIVGGSNNVASANLSTVVGGQFNTAGGTWSLAAGRHAKANHDGAFVWGAGSNNDVASTGTNQFIVRAPGGIWLGTTSTPSITIASDFLNTSTGAHLTIGGVWTNNSDRAARKTSARSTSAKSSRG